jgi:hypothetical protein
MPEKTILIDSSDYRIFATREAGHFRAFWFCPFHDCYEAFRSERLASNKDDAFRIGAEAARLHHHKFHKMQRDSYYPEPLHEHVEELVIHG